MMEFQLTLRGILERARRLASDGEVATLTADGGWDRYTYADAYDRICQLAHALDDLGLDAGDRVGTVATNHSRHFELYFAPAASARSLHTANVRLPDDHFEYVLEDAGDRVLFVDPAFVDRVEQHAPSLSHVEQYVVLAEEVPETSLDPVVAYEDLLAGHPTEYDWPTPDPEAECGLCHTSGTTGLPKGVQHTHRGLARASAMMQQADTVAVTEADTVMPVVPMYHGYAWGYPYAATLAGADLVLPGPHTDAETLVEALERERVTLTAAVPTVWIDVAAHLESGDADLSSLERIQTGGSSPPASLLRRYEETFDVPMLQAWGMTETAPFATLARAPPDVPADERLDYRSTAGRPVAGIEVRVRDDGATVPRDGESAGELEVRGEWVIDAYNDRPEADVESFTEDGWLRTGDVATWDERGFVNVVDRLKDVIKSGGEWISSVELENELMAHPDVRSAAIVGVSDDTWQERPFGFVVPAADATVDTAALDAHLRERFPKWWLPDGYEVVEQLPTTSTGKFDKRRLAERAEGSDA